MIAQQVAFGAVALAMCIAAIRVVTTKNIVHAALYLVVVLAGVAGIYVLLAAEFLAVVQILVYIGAIVVLFLFGIMLTRAPIGRSNELDNDQRVLGAVVSLFLFGVLATLLWQAFGDTRISSTNEIQQTGDLGTAIFQRYVIPFEVVSVLLTAALVGAIVVARRD